MGDELEALRFSDGIGVCDWTSFAGSWLDAELERDEDDGC